MDENMKEESKKIQRTKKAKDVSTKVDKEKLKVSILKPKNLLIGLWEFKLTNEGDELVVKFLFVTKQFALEVSRNGCRQKIEFAWSNIIGIRATLMEYQPETLDVELLYPPKFYKELEVDLRTHNKWVDGLDFTGGNASVCRRYLIMFPPGILKEHFERLTNSDKRLCELSQSPYPTCESAYFPSQTVRPSNQTLQLTQGADNQIPQTQAFGLMRLQHSRMMLLPQQRPTNELIQPQPTISSEEALQMRMPMVRSCNNFQIPSSSSRPQYSQVPNGDPNGHSLIWGSLSNGPTDFNGVSNEWLWNEPTNSNRASNDYLLNRPTHDSIGANYGLLNEPTNSMEGNGQLLNESLYFNAASNGCLLNGPIIDSNGVSNGHMLIGPTHDSFGASNEPTNYNGASNDYSLNYRFSNLPTDPHGVWLPPPPQSNKED